MSDSEEDSIGSSLSSDSEFSDFDSRDESPSSGYVDDESASVRSASTANSDSKKKKKVTFQSDENLVLIREIPARGLFSRWTLESDSESDTEGESSQRVRAPNNCIAKGNYEVKKSSGRTAAKVAAITGATLPKKAESKRATKRRSVKKEKRKEATVSDSNGNEEPPKTKGKGARVKGGKKHSNKGSKSKCKNEQKDSATDDSVPQNIASSVTSSPVTIPPKCEKNSGDVERIPNAKSNTAVRLVDFLDNNCDKDANPIKRIEKVCIVEEEFTQNSTDFLDAIIQSSDRLDVRTMSKTNRRLYSWLMANGNIPNPQEESPCIAPMWDSSCPASQGTYQSVVKAPT
ncbi:uncharacterized protein LOC134234918 [Saccostrea cucullata]|uniref:uncharacterized protein LOC134234918 n=1 Tax=Saccostrea cuccullata TaxID=36930 RepID=UPI002ED16366